MARKATIEDIARLAGVSRGTVSRVLNHRPDVDRETRAHVQRIIDEQGYVPSLTAAGLAGGRNRLIGMVAPVFTWSILGELVRGITDILNRTSYELVLYTFNDEDLTRNRRDIINRLVATQLTAGLIAVYPGALSEQLTELYEQGVPVVVVDDQREHVMPWVRADDEMGAYTAVQRLIQLGHQRIAHIQGPDEYLVSHDRHQGYLRALAEAGLAPDEHLICLGDFLPESGYRCAQTLFDLPPVQRPTAIFASTDQMAYGVLRAAAERGLSAPHDFALIGFDDEPPSAHVRPPLTSVHEPSVEMGQEAVKLLLALLARADYDGLDFDNPLSGVRAEIPQRIVLPTSLVVRASCSAPDITNTADAGARPETRSEAQV